MSRLRMYILVVITLGSLNFQDANKVVAKKNGKETV